MNVEILAVGTELLLGQIVNSNATAIAQRLADRGFSHHHQAVVGDNAERMAEAISAAIRRSDALIITGGIGPTQDDITREVVAEVARVPLTYDDAYADAMRQRWQALGRDFPSSNLRQAYRPEGAEVIRNDKGAHRDSSSMSTAAGSPVFQVCRLRCCRCSTSRSCPSSSDSRVMPTGS